MRRLLLLPLLAGPVLAQEAIPDTIVTGTRIPTAVDRVPAATTTITRQDIEDFGYRTLADALAPVPGLRVVPQGGPGTLTSGFFRGTNSRHVQVLVDGITANDAADPSGAFNFGSLLLAGSALAQSPSGGSNTPSGGSNAAPVETAPNADSMMDPKTTNPDGTPKTGDEKPNDSQNSTDDGSKTQSGAAPGDAGTGDPNAAQTGDPGSQNQGSGSRDGGSKPD